MSMDIGARREEPTIPLIMLAVTVNLLLSMIVDMKSRHAPNRYNLFLEIAGWTWQRRTRNSFCSSTS